MMTDLPLAMSKTPAVYEASIEQGELFADRPNRDLYWEALIQVAKGNQAEAEQWVQAIQSKEVVVGAHPWKEAHPARIEDFFDRLFVESIKYDASALTFLGLFESIGVKDHNGFLSDLSYRTAERVLEQAKADRASLAQYDVAGLPWGQKISAQTFRWLLDQVEQDARFLYHSYPVTQLHGTIQNLTAVFGLFHPLETAQDIQLYIARLKRIPDYMDQAIEGLQEQLSRGIVPPRFAVEKAAQILRKFTAMAPKENLYYVHLASKTGGKKELAQAENVIAKQVYPAYRKLEVYLTTLLEQAKENNGVWALPDGDEYYAYALRKHTTSDLSPAEVHELGLSEVARIQAEMRRLLAEEGFADETKEVGALLREMGADPKYYYPDTESGKKQCLDDFYAIVERTRRDLGALFDLKPKAQVEVRAVPKHEEEGAPAAYYYQPSMDGSRPGAFYVNLGHMEEVEKFRMETLAVHEAEPGHHFQCSLQTEINLPIMRKLGGYTAYVEGWALYTEKLAYEENFYSSVASKLGHLKDELMRAARLVIDTGIHWKRWTREEAIAYMERTTGMAHDEVVSEVERYFVLPGQACAYKIGQLKILALRQKAKDALGERFDIRQFHNVVLETAAVPLAILEQCIDHYIEQALGS